MTVRAWQVLRDLPAWQITQIPCRPHGRDDSGGSRDQADLGTAQRLQALVSAFHYGAPVGFRDCQWPLDLLRPVPAGAER